MDQLLAHFQLELKAAAPGARVDQLLGYLQSRPALENDEREPVVALTLRHGAHVVAAEARFAPPSPIPVRASPAAACPAPPRAYGASYELADAGTALCAYRATRAPFAPYPIIRHFSFRYTPEERRSDHARLEAFLAATPHVGVLLDLRDNGGGTAADYVLPWYAPRPHRDLNEWVRLNPELTDRGRLRRALRNDGAVDEYVRRSARGERWWVRPFACGGDGCEGAIEPGLGRVTSAPIALLLGPGCRSACDSFAAIWSHEHFGPTVGTPPAAMYTSLRYPIAVRLGDELLGELTIALCGLRWEAAEPWLEGQPLPIDDVVESGWPRRADDLALVEAAIDRLRR